MESARKNASRTDSTTLFVSLGLCMLVLFTYLNASAMPSKKLLNQSIATSTIGPPQSNEHDIGIPTDLIASVKYFKTAGRSPSKPGEIESSVLIDRRGLQYDIDGGLDEHKASRLFAWITDDKRDANITAEVTCFIPTPKDYHNLGATLYQREQRCRALNIFNNGDLRPSFNARAVPKKLQELVTDKQMSIDDMILVTLKRTDVSS